MIIYLAVFAGLLATTVLTLVYLADLYEREPLGLIENTFLAGVVAQLVLVLAVGPVAEPAAWQGWWHALTIIVMAVYLCRAVPASGELDERFDGLVYGVAFATGAACVIHMHNLPAVIAGSPHAAVFATTAAPDLRDLIIVLASRGPSSDLLDQLVLLLQAGMMGACLGMAHRRRLAGWLTMVLCSAVGLLLWGVDQALAGAWPARVVLGLAVVVVGVVLKRGSVFRDRPEPVEAELVVSFLKTVLVVFGAVTLSLALLVALSHPWSMERESPAVPDTPSASKGVRPQ